MGFAEKKGGKLAFNLAQVLSERCGQDLWMLTSELEKLILASEGGVITRDLIEDMTFKRSEVVIWDFLEKLSKKSVQEALRLLHGLLDMGESPHQILAMMIREMRIHAQLRWALDQGMGSKEIARETGLHPFVIQKTLPLTKGFQMKELRKLYQGLYSIDKKIKTGGIQMSTDDMGELVLSIERLIVGMK